MNRLGLMCPSELDPEAKELYDAFYDYTTNRYGKGDVIYILEDGRFVGPFAVQLHTPQVGEHFLGMAKALRQVPGLSDINREIATIVVGVRYDAQYELASHRILGRKFGLSATEIQELLDGKKPASFKEDQSVAFDVAHELSYGSGPLSQGVWDRSVQLLGTPGTTAVIQYVGFYSYVCMILRGFDVKIPTTDSLN